MAKFGINDLIDIKKEETKTGRINDYQEIWLSPYDVKPSEGNFYSQEKIEELADSFLAVGQQQPTVLAKVNGEFQIVSGHRRNLANIKNLERGHQEYQKVRYLYKDKSPAMLELSLLMGNAYNRELTPWEKTRQAQRLKEALIKARDEDGLEIRGKLRDVVADIMNESSSGIARMDSIHNNATPEIKEEFRKGNLNICAAYEAAKLSEEEQRKVAREASQEGGIQAKEIAERAGKSKGEKKREKRKRSLSVVSRLDTISEPALEPASNPISEPASNSVPNPQADDKKREGDNPVAETEREKPGKDEGAGKIKPFRKSNRHLDILREWKAESQSLTVISKAVTDAVERVSNLDTSKAEWTDVEWAVFLASAIMNQADCVSEEDLYLLHDIMIRCQEK